MSWHAAPHRVIGFVIVTALILGQPGSVCTFRCLLGHGSGSGDHVVMAAGSTPSGGAAGDTSDDHASFCRHHRARLQRTAVQLAPLGTMAPCERVTLDAPSGAWSDARNATPVSPAEIFSAPHRPPPRV
ncbi:MAG: hypothetical protein PVF05_08455 [Gemmatimonadales bacterium]|jgi:hypothetical protein